MRTGAQTIVTFNLKDFPEDALAPRTWMAQRLGDFLVYQYHFNPDVVSRSLTSKRNGVEELSASLRYINGQCLNFTGLIRQHTYRQSSQ